MNRFSLCVVCCLHLDCFFYSLQKSVFLGQNRCELFSALVDCGDASGKVVTSTGHALSLIQQRARFKREKQKKDSNKNNDENFKKIGKAKPWKQNS